MMILCRQLNLEQAMVNCLVQLAPLKLWKIHSKVFAAESLK